jgi:hypothetical protein
VGHLGLLPWNRRFDRYAMVKVSVELSAVTSEPATGRLRAMQMTLTSHNSRILQTPRSGSLQRGDLAPWIPRARSRTKGEEPTRNKIHHRESSTLTSRGRRVRFLSKINRVSNAQISRVSNAQINRYTCRLIFTATPVPSIKFPNSIGTISARFAGAGATSPNPQLPGQPKIGWVGVNLTR